MNEPSGRTFICSVVFIDIVRYSQVSIGQQMAMKARLNAAIARSVEGVAESERVILDTGDGAAICYLGDPEDALFAATAINQAAQAPGDGGRLLLRTGINLGPIKLVVDLNGRNNVIGDGINVAQRIMSFAEEGEILVSRSYYEVVSRLTEGNERLFRYMGVRSDKHVREHQLYAFSVHDHEQPDAAMEGLPAVDREAVPYDRRADDRASPSREVEVEVVEAPPAQKMAPEVLRDEERHLARYIGPLARVMVERTAATAGSVAALRRSLGELIADPGDRSAYLAAGARDAEPAPPATPPPVEAAPLEEDAPLVLDPEERALIEHELALAIGPLAKVLVRKAIVGAPDRLTLIERLAAQIRNEHDRSMFLDALRRLTG